MFFFFLNRELNQLIGIATFFFLHRHITRHPRWHAEANKSTILCTEPVRTVQIPCRHYQIYLFKLYLEFQQRFSCRKDTVLCISYGLSAWYKIEYILPPSVCVWLIRRCGWKIKPWHPWQWLIIFIYVVVTLAKHAIKCNTWRSWRLLYKKATNNVRAHYNYL